MKIYELCEKLTELCHEGKAQEEIFIMSSQMVTTVDDDDGSVGYEMQDQLMACALIRENGKIFIRESPF